MLNLQKTNCKSCRIKSWQGNNLQGKSFLCAIYCCFRAILYPHTKICVASGTRGQAINILEKVMVDLVPLSRELNAEIDWKQTKVNGTNAIIMFRNGSYIKVVTAGESARGNRAHVLILDEFRLINKDTIDTILRKFLSSARAPVYSELTKEEKKAEKQKERNRTLYFSSGYYQDHWSYLKCTDTCVRMLRGGKDNFIVGLPWQLAVIEDLLFMDDVEAEMTEADFTEVKWAMEMDAVFWGAGDGSFFDYNVVAKNRHLKYPMYPARLAAKFGSGKNVSNVVIPPKQPGEIRILSADIALMSSKKHNNDATAVFLNQMMPTKAGRYTSNFVFTDSMEGAHTDDQALLIRKYFDEFDCDYIVLDCQGVGMGCYDALVRDINDPDSGEVYPALSCCNDATMAERCTVPNAPRVIWAMKATAQVNSDCAILLRDGFRSGRVRLLVNEYDADELLCDVGAYTKLNPPEKLALQMPYINTTLLIDELVRLQHDEANGRVRIFEKAGARKDRYSSLAYNYYVATQIEAKTARRNNASFITKDNFIMKAPKYGRGTVTKAYGREKARGWS